MLELEGRSTAAKIGKILILIGIILGIVSALTVLMIATLGLGIAMTIPRILLVFLIPLGMIKVAGVIVGIFAFKSTAKNEFHNAGILAIVASLLPPLDLIMLIGGVLCLVSTEART